ncbi:hypothetical protein DSCO28_03400 [Desulfosarcina ovata subsp. sediminis]|uniref:SAM-dependent methyltransferase n=2 Tax=Desulfosarcina ovata TaxID=83564 RepID=A0A5K7ZET0_9BACT|nr:hypothetical protein DSCO28_03400 [Desulfosarcina ovata subsp. sediminis]
MLDNMPCQICGDIAKPLDVVDFNKCCEERRGLFLRFSGIAVYYYFCSQCGFCFAPDFRKWSDVEFSKYIYNQDYVQVDPDYVEARPKSNAALLVHHFKAHKDRIRHLDFGSGSGLLSRILQTLNWKSNSYDPFAHNTNQINGSDKFNLITAYEVFEHVSDVNGLMAQLFEFMEPGGMILVSTLLSDGYIFPHQRLAWWYASPRNGHISLFSKNSLEVLSKNHGFSIKSVSPGLHVLYREKMPDWGMRLFS